MSLNLDTFLKSFGCTLSVVDTNSKKILEATFDDGTSAKDIDYYTFANKIIELENIKPESIDINQYITWVNKTQEDSSLVIKCETKQGKEERFKFRITKPNNGLRSLVIYKMSLSSETTLIVDPLTGLYMKNGMMTVVSKELVSTKPRDFSLIVIDIDNFKSINDMYGHLFGDYILKEVSSVFKKHFSDAYIGRIGGDEFLIIDFKSHDYNSIWNTMHNLYNEIRTYDFTQNIDSSLEEKMDKDFDIKNFKLTLTSGIVRYPVDGKVYDDLFGKADKALYRGKKKGKDCFIIYKQDLHANIVVEKNNTEFGQRDIIIFESIINAFLTQLETGDSFEETVKRALKIIANYFQLDRICMYKKSRIFSEDLITYYASEDCPLAQDLTHHATLSEDEVSVLDFDRVIKRTDVEHLKKWPKIYKFFKSLNIKSFVHLPLIYNDTVYGYVRFDMVSENKTFNEEELIFYKIISKILSLYLYTYTINGDKMLFLKDNLTGLDDFNTAISKLQRKLMSSKEKTVILYSDFYKFRFFNDNFGYETGDLVLKLLAQTINNSNFDITSRLNGDHFMVTFEYKSDSDVIERVEQYINDVKKELVHIDGTSALNFLVGVYVTSGFEDNAKSCLDKARQALISLEQSQHTLSYKVYDTTLNQEYKRNKNIISNFESSLKNGDFKIYLQPKFDAKTDTLIGAEALTRWQLNGKIMPPDSYIPLLEEYNLIEFLDLYVFSKVMKLLKRLKEENIKQIPISVNVSKNVSNILDYVDRIEELRKEYDIDSKYIEIEFTESIINYDEDTVAKAIHKLKDLGYKIDMDDFGKGSSNLELLSRDLFDVIKLDKSLTQRKSPNDSILTHVVALIKALELDIVCEGVETEEDKNRIIKAGARIIQGYYYSKPIPSEEFEDKYLK